MTTATKPQSIDDLTKTYEGKVRNVYDYGDGKLLLIASDRVSAFDVVFAEPIPNKGAVLNLLSTYWFNETESIIRNHLITTRDADILQNVPADLEGKMALAYKADPIRFECVVRGHLDGSGWKEYQETGKLAGYDVPAGLNRYDALPEPLFTPARKMLEGHDENITVNIMREEYGVAETNHLQDISLKLFKFAYDKLKERGIMLLDTKFEFGLVDGQMTLIDEVFTPDSSRFRVLPDSENGESQPLALDKQYLRDHLTQLGFTGEGEPPKLDDDVRNELSNRYKRVFQMITGSTLEEALTAQK